MNTSIVEGPTLGFVSKDGLIGFILCLIACGLTLFSFWRLGGVSDAMLVVTDYVTELPTGQSLTFGYGGVKQTSGSPGAEYQNPDVPFQSRVMSSFSFTISRVEDGNYWIEGLEDSLLIGGQAVESGHRVILNSGTRLKTVGRYGSASFTAQLNEQPGRVRLHLDSPIYYRLSSNTTRVTFGLVSQIVATPVDELTVRTKLKENQAETFIVAKKEDGDFSLTQEADLARLPSIRSEVLSGLSNPDGQAAQAATIRSNDSIRAGTAIVKLKADNGMGLLASDPTWAFGLKLSVVIFLLAIAFGVQGLGMYDTQVRLPHGPIIFGCVAVFAAVGLTLAARDYFLPPFDQGRFPEYLKWFFASLTVLYLIRIPVDSFYQWRWALSFPAFLLAYILLGRPFDNLFFLPFVEFVALFFLGAVAVHWLMRGVIKTSDFLIDADWLRVLLFAVLLPIAGIFLLTLLTGGRSALNILGLRFHLPTVLTVLFTFGTVLAVSVCERENSLGWQKHRTIALGAMLGAVGFYYFLSGFDHGGTIVLGVGVIAAMWAAARRNRPWAFTTVLAILIVGVLYLAVVLGQERIDIAWGGIEGAERYFDEAVNLRTARDLARSGGLFGLYDQLYIPSSVSMNIYNDLVTAYIAGFFGAVGLFFVMVCFYLFYTRLLEGIFGLVLPTAGGKGPKDRTRSLATGDAWLEMPSPVTKIQAGQSGGDSRDPAALRHVLTAFAISIVTVFLFQLLWVVTATLWRRVPISGLDLQPVSASVISIVAFVVILVGSVVFVHNACRYEEGQQLDGS